MITFVFSLVCFVNGLIYYYQYAAIAAKDRKAKDWPSVLGTVESASLNKQHRAHIAQSNHTEYRDVSIPRIKYTYAVNGTVYENSRIGFGRYIRITDGLGRKLMERFPHGASVAVYYDPADPNESVLEKRSTYTYGMYAFSIASMIAGILFFGVWLAQIFA
jgi:hypothetical protein